MATAISHLHGGLYGCANLRCRCLYEQLGPVDAPINWTPKRTIHPLVTHIGHKVLQGSGCSLLTKLPVNSGCIADRQERQSHYLSEVLVNRVVVAVCTPQTQCLNLTPKCLSPVERTANNSASLQGCKYDARCFAFQTWFISRFSLTKNAHRNKTE